MPSPAEKKVMGDVLARAVEGAGGSVRDEGSGQLTVFGLGPDRVGDLAFGSGVRLHELVSTQASLEQAFMEVTGPSVEFRAGRPQTTGENQQQVLTGRSS
ncbi:MAG TPA: hypothetical protein VMF65_04965 [Acidimicrobiales bacterium]|nr:hypothetical protein [Acidimicrobiales bacterium]